jgi:hypothetical protein
MYSGRCSRRGVVQQRGGFEGSGEAGYRVFGTGCKGALAR